MKYLNKFKIFESLISEGEFIDRYLDERKVKINKSGEIIYDGVVIIKNVGLKNIPVKFKSVDNYIMVNDNYLSNFHFLPDDIRNVNGYGYHIGGNNLKGRFKEIVDILYKPNTGIYYEIYYDFIRECLSFEVWENNQQNDLGITEAWKSVKLDHYNQNKDRIMYGINEVLDLEDEEILRDFFNIESDYWEEELIDKLVEKIKNSDDKDSQWALTLLFILIKNDESEDIKEIIQDKYDLTEIYKRRNSDIKNWKPSKLSSFTHLMKEKLKRDETKIQRDEENDLFVFIGSDKFEENKDGSYSKKLEIEKLIKINIYNESELGQVNLMKVRARVNNKDVYMIWMPKGTFEDEKDGYYEEEIPDWLISLIDKKKTKI